MNVVVMLVMCVEKKLEFVSITQACLFFIDLFVFYRYEEKRFKENEFAE